MLRRRLREFWKSANFWVVMGLSEDATVRDWNISILRVVENCDSEACESIFQIHFLFSRNVVK